VSTIGGAVRGLVGAVALLVVAILLAIGPAAGGAVSIGLPKIEFSLHAGFSPAALSKHIPTPGVVRFATRIWTVDGSHPSALKEFTVELDRDVKVDFDDIPACRLASGIPDISPPGEDCEKAIIGHGSVGIEVELEDSTVVPSTNPLTIYNGGIKKGARTLYAVAEVNWPVPAELLFPIKVRQSHARETGTEAIVSVPKIAGGAGSVTSFTVRLGRRLVDRGRLASLISLTCADEGIDFRAKLQFADGTFYAGVYRRSCTSKD
jgi:hypothetical protein